MPASVRDVAGGNAFAYDVPRISQGRSRQEALPRPYSHQLAPSSSKTWSGRNVVDTALDAGYRALAADTAREAEAQEWYNALAGDLVMKRGEVSSWALT